MKAMTFFRIISIFLLVGHQFILAQMNASLPIWEKVELTFSSDKTYENVLYDVKEFGAVFTSPTGRIKKLNGFWDGGENWKIRFLPDEVGVWQYTTFCSDEENQGLKNQKGQLEIGPNKTPLNIYQHGAVTVKKGDYFFSHNDGTPFFWTACTAWNGALKSTRTEWNTYLKQRAENHFSAIQYVATQWRGGETNAEGQIAFDGIGRIEINTEFFKRIDERTDQINKHGIVAAPVLLWALPSVRGRHLSPGYTLPNEEAVMLAKYMVARLQGNHVVWILGGDGKYLNENEQRWKYIGREVFGEIDHAPVTLHPSGKAWIAPAFNDEDWLDFIGYQSSHSTKQNVVDWINKGPVASSWHRYAPRPMLNMEPCYEQIYFRIDAKDVRNASYWSLLSTPVSGITYGAHGVWSWIQREGELVVNHDNPGGRGPSTWKTSIDFPGSIQIGQLSRFIQEFEWWTLKPAPEMVVGDTTEQGYDHFIPVVSDNAKNLILAYVPQKMPFSLRLSNSSSYTVQWFDPIKGKLQKGGGRSSNTTIALEPPTDQDWVLVLKSKKD